LLNILINANICDIINVIKNKDATDFGSKEKLAPIITNREGVWGHSPQAEPLVCDQDKILWGIPLCQASGI